jgi:flagellar hook-associated protein 3 FlgL
MRITTANTFDRSIDTMQRRSQAMAEAQERLISGKKIARASDDPTGAARVERALAREARATANQRALEASRNASVLTEGALGDTTELLNQARELIVQAGNPSYTDAQRSDMSKALKGLRDQILQISNRDDGAGGFLFGSQGASSPPFVDSVGGVQFRGSEGVLKTASDEPLPLTSDGGSIFLRGVSGNGVFVSEPADTNSTGAWIDAGQVTDPSALTGDPYEIVFSVAPDGTTTYDVLRNGTATGATGRPYVAGQAIEADGMAVEVSGTPAQGDRFTLTPAGRDLSVFDALDRAIVDLAQANRSGAQRTQTVATALRDIDASLASMVGERSRLGEVLNRTDAVEGRIADASLLAKTERSAAEDIDMVQAVSDFSARQTSYDAALKAYSMVQKLSLFDYIR